MEDQYLYFLIVAIFAVIQSIFGMGILVLGHLHYYYWGRIFDCAGFIATVFGVDFINTSYHLRLHCISSTRKAKHSHMYAFCAWVFGAHIKTSVENKY